MADSNLPTIIVRNAGRELEDASDIGQILIIR